MVSAEHQNADRIVRLDQRDSVYQIANWSKIRGAALEVANGATLRTGAVSLGESSHPVSAVSVSGKRSAWEVLGSLGVAQDSMARLTIAQGGKVKCGVASLADRPTARAETVVRDPDSLWSIDGALTIGNAGPASLKLARGAQATVSNWMAVGDRGEGELIISGATKLAADDHPPASAAVVKPKTAMTVGAAVTIGNYQPGRLVVTDGATLSNGNWATIGYYENAIGTAVVSGKGSCWTIGFTLSVGYAARGHLEITDGATVATGHTAGIGEQPQGVGTVLVSGKGSSLTFGNYVEIGERGDGTVTVADGASVHAKSRLEIGAGGGSGRIQLSGDGVLTVDGPLTNQGALELEAPRSRIHVNHDFSQEPEGRTIVWLGGGGSPAVLQVAGNAELAGALEIKVRPEAQLKKGDVYVLLTAKNVQQWFDKIVAAPELSALEVRVQYAPQQVLVELD